MCDTDEELGRFFMDILADVVMAEEKDFELAHGRVKEMFDSLDADGNGSIDVDECFAFFKNWSEEEIDDERAGLLAQQMMREMDANGDGQISFDEIWNVVLKTILDCQDLHKNRTCDEAFQYEMEADADGDGYGDEEGPPEDDAPAWQHYNYEIEQRARKIIADCAAERTRWEDPEFPPVHSSAKASNVDCDEFDLCEWRRARDFIEESGEMAEIFNSGISQNDVCQGSVGDCYFLSALAAVAKAPVAIRHMFYTKLYNSAGCFVVYLHINGVKKAVMVDDYFPVNSWGQPLFGHGPKNEIWVNILEKAFAKESGSYSAISGAMSMY
jgi:hypothetical protein